MTDDRAVTIAMLTRNAEPFIGRILDALATQRTRRRVEWLAVDSGSTDGTLDLLKERDVRTVAIPTEDFNWGRTRDLAYQETSTPIVVNLSQDAVPTDEDWLENLVRPLSDPEVGASCGSSRPDPDRQFAQFTWERNGYFYFTREIKKFVSRYGRGLSFANSAVPRDVWERLRFDPQPTGEDFQFQTKLHEARLRIAFPDDAPVFHHHNYAFYRLFKRCRNEGMALRLMGCAYTEWDLVRDLASPPKYVQWLRELKRGSLNSLASATYPVLRPVAVYVGSRFARRPVWY
ncbi:MAG: glycosyltransferase family 2 protein [bacterium]|nr:glycosyltransferase family 2 protein [bacterium]